MDRNGKEDDTVAKINGMEFIENGPLKGYGMRHQQCFIMFLCLTTAYTMRSCMGVALVAMVDSEDHTENLLLKNDSFEDSHLNTSDTGVISNSHEEEIRTTFLFLPPYPQLKWTKKSQDIILSSFQWGYMCLQIPGGQLAHRFGSRFLLTGSLTINCLVSFIIPWAAYYGGWILTVICRIIQGLSQACIIPGMHTAFGKWAPLEERARLAGFALGGQALGTVLGLPITGYLAASSLGWPGIFRFYGILSGIVAVLLWFTLSDSPAQHPRITVAERRYIEEGLGQSGDGKKHLPVPWSRILRCRGLYAIIIAHIGQTWGQLTLYTEVPAFMAHVMGVNIKANGLLTALPFLVMWITNFFFSWFTDMLIVKKWLTVTNARKFANSLGSVPAAIGLVALAYVPKNIYIVESVLVLICAFKISAHVGFQVNHIDISPNFAGTLMSISNFASNVVGSSAPVVAGIILTDVKDELLWRKVFFVASGLYFLTNLVYVILGTAEKADWNDPPPRKETEDDVENIPEQEAMIKKSKKVEK